MTAPRVRGPAIAMPARGFSLVELMIALVLGLVVTGTAIALLLANRQTYVASENVGRMQENARTAFELMSRDIREAAGNPCGAPNLDTINVLEDSASRWYTDFTGGIRGYGASQATPDRAFGAGNAQRVAGTDAIDLITSFDDGVAIRSDAPASAEITLSTATHNLTAGDIAVACDSDHAAIFQVTQVDGAVLEHAVGTGTPGNCTQGLGTTLDCTSTAGVPYQFGCQFGGTSPSIVCTDPASKWSAAVAKFKATRWYVGNNDRGGTSLYQSAFRNAGGSPAIDTNEIIEGVDDLTLTYLSQGGTEYADAATVADWSRIVSVKVNLHIVGKDKVGTDKAVLQRTLEHVVAIRNRIP